MMNPRVVFIAGPLKGSDFELGEEALSVGRDSTNVVRLADSLLSRRHCRIERAGGRLRLTDLANPNGPLLHLPPGGGRVGGSALDPRHAPRPQHAGPLAGALEGRRGALPPPAGRRG